MEQMGHIENGDVALERDLERERARKREREKDLERERVTEKERDLERERLRGLNSECLKGWEGGGGGAEGGNVRLIKCFKHFNSIS